MRQLIRWLAQSARVSSGLRPHNGTLEERLYVAQDANWNVTALFDSSGVVVERFRYEAYGKREVLNAAWASLGSDPYAFQHGFAGGKHDATSNRVHFRHRDYDTALMRWSQEDPIGFAAGDMNLYRYVGKAPNDSDPSGLWGWDDEIRLIPTT